MPESTHPAHLKRRLLLALVDAWADALARREEVRRADAEAPVRLALVDAFAAAGYQRPPTSELGGEWADPAALVRALDAAARRLPGKGESALCAAVFAEEDPVKVGWIRDALQAGGLGGRVRGALADEPGAVVVLEGRPAELGVWDWLRGRHALVCLDPASPAQLPWAQVERLAEQRAELVIGLPLAPLHRTERFRSLAVADLPPYPRRVVDGYLALLGTSAELTRWWGGDAGPEGVPDALMEYYVERLDAPGEGRARAWPLALGPAPDERHALALLSRHPELALRLNEALHAAREAGALCWPDEPASEVVRYHEGTPLELFGAAGAAGRVREVDLSALAHALAKRFRGRTVALDEALWFAAGLGVFEVEARRALALLKRDGRVLYRSLSAEGAELAFPRHRTAAPRGRRRRAAAEELVIPWEEME